MDQALSDFIVLKIKELTFESVNVNTPLITSKVLDSIVAVDLAVAIEEHCGIAIPFTEITEENFETVEKILAYLEAKN